MKYIETGKTRSDAKYKVKVIVDDENYEYLNSFYWQADKNNCVCGAYNKNSKKRILIHRLILKAKDYQEIDHINGNRLDNQKCNLRFVTSSQNKINRGARKDCKSGFKGVSWHKQRNKWTARIMYKNKYHSLGLYEDIKKAADAYNNAAINYYGEYAWINKL